MWIISLKLTICSLIIPEVIHIFKRKNEIRPKKPKFSTTLQVTGAAKGQNGCPFVDKRCFFTGKGTV